ncbi:MAG: CRISPR-associated protein Csx16 [Methylococcales bacterium]|nr:CRISPR-associated protein Csx16 [Methylococcales bacterium]
MTTFFVTRHTGAKQWATEQGIEVDFLVDHLNIEDIQAGDTVLGSLPVNLVAELNAKGARYFHLSLSLSEELRGKEISAKLMRELGAKLEEFAVQKIN